MLRKLGFLVITLGLVLPASAAEKPGSISGYVRSATGLPQMGALVEVLGSAARSLQVFTDENFNAEVLKSTIPVLVDFTATWCAPCQWLAPVIEELAGEYQGKVKIGKLDIDQCGDTASRYGIMSVPTVISFRNGQPVETLVGLNTKSFYKDRINSLIGPRT